MRQFNIKIVTSSFIFLLVIVIGGSGFAQMSQKDKDSERQSNTDKMDYYSRERDYLAPGISEVMQDEQGWAKYIRSTIHDGNLIESSFINQGQLADGWLEGSGGSKMIWPKGSEVEYGWAFIFFVAGEVTDIHGNVIHIVSDRFSRYDAETSPDQSHRYHWMPLPKYFNNHHPDSEDWDIGGISEDMGIDGIPNSNDEGEGDGILQPVEDINRNGVLDLSMTNVVEWSAISHRRETWPTWWPAQSYPGDDRSEGDERPGVRAGRWNGEFGAYIRSSQESYYLMDDHENDEFEYYPFDDSLSMRPWPYGKRGLGVTVEVRHYQWNARLAEDILISIYDIINYGKPIPKAVIGMYAEPDVGGHAHSDEADFDRIDDITYAWDKTNVAWNGLPTAYFGFAFLESPGLPFNRIDDDEDGLVDESQTNGIDDDGDWRAWEDLNGNGIYDNEDFNYNGQLDDGEDVNNNGKLDFEPMWDDIGSDGIGPEYDGYTGPDPDGSEANGIPDLGEPNFETTDNDESDQVGLTSWYLRDVDSNMEDDENFWRIELQPGRFAIDPEYARDLGWVYGSGFVELTSGKEGQHRYAIACLFGNDEQDIFRNKRTMQNIYDADYNFAKSPRQPIVKAEVSDGRVVLTWDDNSERSRDPIYGKDFEGYRVYKSTYPTFTDIKTISDAFGNPLLYEPVAQFDLKDGLIGPHTVNLGGNGEVGLGVAYDMGTDNGLRHYFIDTDVTNGRTYYYAVTAYDKGYDHDFFDRGLTDREGLMPISPTECSFSIQTDPIGRVIFIDRNCAAVIPMEAAAGYLVPQTESGVEHISGFGTGDVKLEVMAPYSVKNDHTYQLSFADDSTFEEANSLYTGFTNGACLVDIISGDTLFSLQGENTLGSLAEMIIDGFMFVVDNSSLELQSSKWIKGNSNLNPLIEADGSSTIAVPRDFEIRISHHGIDSTVIPVKPTNFEVWDVTDPDNQFRMKYQLTENPNEPDSLIGILSDGDKLVLKDGPKEVAPGVVLYTQNWWSFDFAFSRNLDQSLWTLPEEDDIYRMKTNKPFNRNDVYEFTMIGNEYREQTAKNDLNNIYTVPNPYVAASTLERRIVSQEVGRGERRIDFVNLPKECTISIFTSSGRLVKKIEHSSSIDKGRASWDLTTTDGLEVAHGVYFYHVDAKEIGTKVGKLAIIK